MSGLEKKKGFSLKSLFPLPWYFTIGLPLALSLFFWLAFTWEPMEIIEARTYDTALGIRRSIEEHDSIVLLNIDDRAVDLQGVWPWNREVVAEGLFTAAELGAASIVLDIEYSSESPAGFNPEAFERDLPALLRQELGGITDRVSTLLGSIRDGSATRPELADALTALAEASFESRIELENAIRQARRDPDRFLGRAASAAGMVYAPFVLSLEGPIPGSDAGFPTVDRFALPVEFTENATLRRAESVLPMIEPLREGLRSAGFANNRIDPDGVTRTVDLLIEGDDGLVLPQLTIPLYLELSGVNQVEVSPNEFRFHMPERTVRVPRLDTGEVLVTWPRKTYLESFEHLSYARLLDLQRSEDDLIFNLERMNEAGYFQFYEGVSTPLELLSLVNEARATALEGGEAPLIAEYADVKRAYLGTVGRLLQGDTQDRIIAEIESQAAELEEGSPEREELEAVVQNVRETFERTRGVYRRVTEQRRVLGDAIEGSNLFVGFTATATTDRGVTPFDPEYVNLGLHASVLNMLLQEDFLSWSPAWLATLLSAVVASAVGVLMRRRRPWVQLLVGVGAGVVAVTALVLVFALTGLYLHNAQIAFSVFSSFGALTFLAYIENERDKRWLHGAFEHYISAEFIEQLVHDPEKLNLGGEERELTALFSDIKQFSGIAERLAPTTLVDVLNRYLSVISDAVLNESGTIDKYEGDAMVAFFGAPVSLSDHARRACEAALSIKEAENRLNKDLMRDAGLPSPLYTRIGINTGRMLVGNLGTDRRMDYTILGHEANLASRLEGVNKQYGTWVIISEHTAEAVGDAFLTRRLDRVRVVGVEEPVRIFQLMGRRGEETPLLREALQIFDEGLDAYEKRDFELARNRFEQVRKIYPDDSPSGVFIRRCDEFIESAPAEDWDASVKLVEK